MISYVTKAQVVAEELKRISVANSLEDINKKLDKLYMVQILRSLYSDFEHIRNQILADDQIPSIDSLVIRLLWLPTLLKYENSDDVIETSAMVAPKGREGGSSNQGGHGGQSGHP